MRNLLKIAAVALLLSVPIAVAGGIKVWTTNDTLTSADLNANFSHIHSLMVGGHGARLVNADVSATASIAHTKLATPALLPKAWAAMSVTCTTGTCGLAASQGVTSIVYGGSPGAYTVTVPARADANYGVILTSATANVFCRYGSPSTTAFGVVCRNDSGTDTNAQFTVLLMDNDN